MILMLIYVNNFGWIENDKNRSSFQNFDEIFQNLWKLKMIIFWEKKCMG